MLWSLSGLSFISVDGSLNQQHFSRLVKRNAILCGTFIRMFGSGSENLKLQANILPKYQSHAALHLLEIYTVNEQKENILSENIA